MQLVQTKINSAPPSTLLEVWIKVGISNPLTDDWDAMGLAARLEDFGEYSPECFPGRRYLERSIRSRSVAKGCDLYWSESG
jgi:hypothetical protein